MRYYIPSSTSDCDAYWDKSDWIPPLYIVERWCQQDADAHCRRAKLQALLTACDNGTVNYKRSDGKDYDDALDELCQRGILLIERSSFNAWAVVLEGKSPLAASVATTARAVPRPSWATDVASPPPFTTPSWAGSAALKPALPITTFPSAPPIAAPDTPSTDDIATATDAPYPSDDELHKLGVPAAEIIEAFRVEANATLNKKWWRDRMGNVVRYKKLEPALVQKGMPSRGDTKFPSWWRPDSIAIWLIEQDKITRHRAVEIIHKKFPKWAYTTEFF